MISKEVIPVLINKVETTFTKQLIILNSTLLDYAKRKDINNSGRKYFYTAIEELDLKLNINGNNSDDLVLVVNDEEMIDDDDHERTEQDEIFNHVMVEEGYNTHSPLEDLVKHNGKHQVINLVDEDEEDVFVDPYENLSDEDMIARLPPYFNKSHKQKKKFFNKLNQKYLSSLRNPSKGNGEQKAKVNFDLKKNAIRKFRRHQKICD